MQMSQHLSISLVFPDKAEAAFNAIKESTLQQEVIEDLTAEGTFNKVLTRAGFGIGRTSEEGATLQGFVFKEILGEYNEDFLNIIAPYVSPNSYIEIEAKYGLPYRWKFDGATCKKIYPKLIWD